MATSLYEFSIYWSQKYFFTKSELLPVQTITKLYLLELLPYFILCISPVLLISETFLFFFNEIDLMERLGSYGRSGFNLQFMLDTTLSDANKYPLKLNDLILVSGCTSWKEAPAKIQWASGRDQLQAVSPDIPNVGLKADYFTSYLYMSDEFAPFEGSVMSIDPSGRGEDKTAYWTVEYYCGYSILKNDKELKIPIDVISDKKILNLCPLQDEEIL